MKSRRKPPAVYYCLCGKPALPKRKWAGFVCQKCLEIEKKIYAGKAGLNCRDRKFLNLVQLEDENNSLLVR